MLERITITIKKELLEKLDSIIDNKEVKNRSHAIEKMIEKGMNSKNIDTILIMAGSEDEPSMKLIENKPVLEKQIEMLKRNGITNLIVSISKKHKKTQEYFSDGKKFGVNIKYIVEDKPLGTCGALYFINEEKFAFLNVDTLIDVNIEEMYKFHKKNNATATLLVTAVKDPKAFGSVKIQGNKVIDFIEKPIGKGSSLLVNAGFCIFDKNVKNYINKDKIMIEELFKKLIVNEEFYAFIHDKPVIDILKNSI